MSNFHIYLGVHSDCWGQGQNMSKSGSMLDSKWNEVHGFNYSEYDLGLCFVCEINVWTSWTSCTMGRNHSHRQGASPAWMSSFAACRLVTGDPQNSERRKGSNEIHRKLVFVHGLVPTLLAFQHLWDKESLLVPWLKKNGVLCKVFNCVKSWVFDLNL